MSAADGYQRPRPGLTSVPGRGRIREDDPPNLGAWIALVFLILIGVSCLAALVDRDDRIGDDAEFTNVCRSRCDAVGLEAFEVDLANRTCMCRQVRQ